MDDIKDNFKQENQVVVKKRGRPKIHTDRKDYLKQNYQKNKDTYKQKYEENKNDVKQYNKTQQEKYRKCYKILMRMIEENDLPSKYKDDVKMIYVM